ncbi:hypothetical protein PTKU15_16940 [Paraburkholderia terrae]|nr:hypothetical protein PTKU15_16940 [Paraburkholderia terrae]
MDIGLGRRNKAVVRQKRRHRSKVVVRRDRVAILLARRLRTREDAHPGRRPRKAVAVPPGHLLRRLLRVLRDRRPARAADIRPGLRAAVATPGRQRLQDKATKARITDCEAGRGLFDALQAAQAARRQR